MKHKHSWLKKARVWVSVIFLLFTVSVFLLQAVGMPVRLIQSVTWIQFVPSLIHFLHFAGYIAAGFLLVILLALVFGRIYCAGICPLGTLQDFFSWLHRRVFRQKPFSHSKARNKLRFILLAVVVISLLSGTTILISLLDPFSIFGKIMSNMFRPLFFAVSNGLAGILEQMDVFIISRTGYKGFYWEPFLISAALMMLIVGFSWYRGRLFCNTICPVGTLLGLISRFSLFRIVLDKQACSGCGHCSRVCKAQCIDVKEREVDFSRCVTCFNCLGVCPSDGVNFVVKPFHKPSGLRPPDPHTAKGRRIILKSIMLTSAFIPLRALAARVKGGEKPTVIPENKRFVPSPPGSVSHADFHLKCTACHLCVSACPTQVLQPSFIHYGLQGFLQPFLENHVGFCNYDCIICGEVCPTGAIQPLKPDEKKLTQIGVAKFITENCVVYTDKTDCGACSEHCPTKAVNMVPYQGRLTIPEVNDKICIGCGACEYACPTIPYKAIFIEGLEVHRQAEKPVTEEIKLRETTGDFPF